MDFGHGLQKKQLQELSIHHTVAVGTHSGMVLLPLWRTFPQRLQAKLNPSLPSTVFVKSFIAATRKENTLLVQEKGETRQDCAL